MNDTQPSQFIITSDFPTLKNEGAVSGSIVIPGSIAIAGGGNATGVITMSSGQVGSLSRGRIASTKNFDNWYTGQGIIFNRTGSVGPYGIVAFMWRPSSTQINFQVIINNPSASPMVGEAGDETIYFYSNQFVAPYA